jgi:predicted SnoaL-like aldol condensation-catalyzing enzyme
MAYFIAPLAASAGLPLQSADKQPSWEGDSMRLRKLLLIPAIGLLAATASVHAQTPVTGAPDAEALFTSKDPKLHANKQVAYKIIKELLECGHWERADQYLTERYIQHNPLAADGRAAVVKFFTEVLKQKPTPIPEKMRTKIVSVVAEGDLVTVAYVREAKDPKDPSKTYTTTWFDQWRFKDGKADEHWDPQFKM